MTNHFIIPAAALLFGAGEHMAGDPRSSPWAEGQPFPHFPAIPFGSALPHPPFGRDRMAVRDTPSPAFVLQDRSRAQPAADR